jgi:hypothetical protein
MGFYHFTPRSKNIRVFPTPEKRNKNEMPVHTPQQNNPSKKKEKIKEKYYYSTDK